MGHTLHRINFVKQLPQISLAAKGKHPVEVFTGPLPTPKFSRYHHQIATAPSLTPFLLCQNSGTTPWVSETAKKDTPHPTVLWLSIAQYPGSLRL